MKGIFRKILVLVGVISLGLAIFVFIRIRENDEKAAVRQAEAEKRQVSQAEAQQLDLGGFTEGDFQLLAEPVAATPAPTPEQWRGLRQALASAGPALAALLPPQSPEVSPGFGRLRYAVKAGGWRVMVECRPAGAAGAGSSCEPVALTASSLSDLEAGELQASLTALAPEGLAVYGGLHGRRGTEGMDKLIKEANVPMIYNEFCTDLGCNGSVIFLTGKVMVKVEGSGNLQPWFTALARSAGEGGKR
ncbi:MAG: hypothetical protein HGA96_06380 [Desulfobulbaceae bacterium]|nr:hypothetical protein [Desulfobulbaceae bacterium]